MKQNFFSLSSLTISTEAPILTETTFSWKYLMWNRSPAQVGCMRQVLRPRALGRPRGIGWRGRWEGGPGWGIHVNPWLIHANVWQNPLQYYKVISLQLIKINEKKKKEKNKRKYLMSGVYHFRIYTRHSLPNRFDRLTKTPFPLWNILSDVHATPNPCGC